MGGLNLTQAVQSFTQMFQQLNKVATDTVGMEVHWMRAIPHEKSEDVIFQEYTLHDVDCPKVIKVVTSNTQYNPANFNIDYFGINYEAPFEISVDKETWGEVFGKDTMPQQHDIVFVDFYNTLYEVASSTLEYGMASQEIGYKMQLVKWNPRANVRLNDAVEDTISDLTVSEQELFGEEISKQIADIIDEPETSGLINTSEPSHDKFKSNDIDTVEIGDIANTENTMAKTYYDMRFAKETVIYKNGDVFDTDSAENFRYFSCWFKLAPSEQRKNQVDSLEKVNGVYTIPAIKGITEGSEIDIERGKYFNVHAIVGTSVEVNGKKRYMLTMNNSEFRDATKKITNWNNNLTVTDSGIVSLLMGRSEGKCRFNISIIGDSTLLVKFGTRSKRVAIEKLPSDTWLGIGMNIGEESTAYIYEQGTETMTLLNQIDLGSMSNTFEVGEFYIPKSNVFLTNIRLFRVTEPTPQNIIEKDLNTQLVKNDSKSIVNDNAVVPNTSPFITEQR